MTDLSLHILWPSLPRWPTRRWCHRVLLGPRRRTRRVAARDTPVGELVVPSGGEVTLEIGVAGLPFGAGPHRCPGDLVRVGKT